MEKSDDQKANPSEKASNGGLVWDCGSSLYDSFELKSFKRQLDSAISARTLSMPHLRDPEPSRTFSMPPPHLCRYDIAPPPTSAKKSRNISRSLNKLLRSLFRVKPPAGASDDDSTLFRARDRRRQGLYAFCDKSGGLSTIPEVPEVNSGADRGALSPELKSLVRRTVSDRFTTTRIGVSCA